MSEKSIVAFVMRAKNRVRILKLLSKGEKISAQLGKETGMYKSHVSRALRELNEHYLIKCTNPKDRNYRFYALTKKGKDMLKFVENIK